MTLSEQLQNIALGNEQAFRWIVQYFGKRLYPFAVQIVRNREDAEEVVSDVFLKVWNRREQLPSADGFAYYLYKAVKNTSLNYLKKSKRKKEVEADLFHIRPSVNKMQNPEEWIISQENLRRIHHAINDLPPRCRQIFLLVKEDQLSYKQAAELLDLSEATINVQVSIAIKKISMALKPILQTIPS